MQFGIAQTKIEGQNVKKACFFPLSKKRYPVGKKGHDKKEFEKKKAFLLLSKYREIRRSFAEGLFPASLW